MWKKILEVVKAAQGVLRPRRIALWRRHGEVTRALLVMGLVVVAATMTGILLRAPRPALWSAPEVEWPVVGLWAATVAVVMIPLAVALLTIDLRHAELKADGGSPPTEPRRGLLLPWTLRLWLLVGLAFGVVLFVTASSWQTRLALGLTTVVAALGSCAALWLLGATAILLAGLAVAVTTFLVVDWPLLYDPSHERGAVLVLIVVLVLTLIAVAREFSRTTLRLATLAAVGAVALLTMKLGRLETVADLGREARESATELDVQLADLASEAADRPSSQTTALDRAERALLAATAALDEKSTLRATLMAELSPPAWPALDLTLLRGQARSAAEVEVLGLAETYASLRDQPRPYLGVAASDAQVKIDRYCRSADGHPIGVDRPPLVPTAAGSVASLASPAAWTAYEHCTRGDGTDDGDPRRPGQPWSYAELKAEATWAVTLIRAELRDVPVDDVASAARDAVVAADGPNGDGTPVDLLAAGGVALLSGLPGAGDTSAPAAVTIVGWAVVAGALLLGYRWLEIMNGRTQVGPVSVGIVGAATREVTEPERKRLGELRRHIVRNIDEPGGVPGAETLQPVTDLLESTGQPSGKIVGALLKLVGLVLPKTGYTVDAVFSDVPIDDGRTGQARPGGDSSLAPSGRAETGSGATAKDGRPTQLTVTVLVKDARTGRGQTTITSTSPSEQAALREAGYRVAAWVLGRSSRVPSWASWDESTAAALCEYTEATSSGSAGLAELEQAVRIAPASGVLLGLLGHRYDLERRRAYALSAYLRAIALHPRYPVARYRAAISCSLLAADGAKQWSCARWTLRSELKDGMGAVTDVLGVTWSEESRLAGKQELWGLDGPDAVLALACASDDLLRTNNLALTKRSLVHHAFRRSERSYWLALLLRFRSRAIETGVRRDGLRAVNESARPAVLLRAAAAAPEDQRKALSTRAEAAIAGVRSLRGLTWQVDYNLACASAIASPPNKQFEALEYLQGLVRRPHFAQLKRSWVETDPDLAPLRADDWLDSLELFLRHLVSDPPDGWTVLVQRHVQRVRDARAFDRLVQVSPTVPGAQAVLAGRPLQSVPLSDVREPGETSLRSWQRLPVDRRRQLPSRCKIAADAVLDEEWRLIVASLQQGSVVTIPWRDTQQAVSRAQQVMSARSALLVIKPPGTDLGTGVAGRAVVDGPSSMEYPLFVAVDEPPLDGLFGESLELNHLVGAEKVHFVLHERVGFVRRTGSLVAALSGLAPSS